MNEVIFQSGLGVDSIGRYKYSKPPVIPKSAIKRELTGKLPGFKLNRNKLKISYMPLWYYASIYRKIFGTMEYIDWKAICQNKLQKYNLLKFIAVNDFGLDYKYVRSLKYNQLCAVLTEESERRRRIRLGLGTEVGVVAPEVLYQPGTVFVPKPSVFAPTETTEYVPPEWQELANVCANPDTVSKEYLAFIAGRMGVRKSLPKDLTGMSNNQICKSLLNYVKLVQRGRHPI